MEARNSDVKRGYRQRGEPVVSGAADLPRADDLASKPPARTDDECRRHEATFRALAENAPDIILRFDRELRHVYVNKALTEAAGRPREAFIGKRHAEVGYPDHLVRFWDQSLEEVFRPGRESVIEFTHHDTRGERHFEGRLVPEAGSDGTVETVLVITRDITERVNAERALRDSEKRYRLLADSLPGAVYLCRNDRHFSMLYVNDQIAEITGYPRDEFLRNRISFADLYHPEDALTIHAEIERAVANRRVFRFSYRIRHRNGEWRWVEEHGTAVYDGGQRVQFIEGFISDITERKQAEAEHRSLEEQLRQSQKMDAIGQLAGGVACDFNNLLTVVLGNTERALRLLGNGDGEKGAQSAVDALHEVKEAAVRGSDLTRQLLVFGRRQMGRQERVDVNDLVTRLEGMIRSVIGESIQIRTETDPHVVPVLADPALLEHAIMNLVLNARDAMPDGGTLVIHTANLSSDRRSAASPSHTKNGARVAIAVTDSGFGMPEQIREHLFEPFFTTKPVGQGTGLGLATTYGIVNQIGGQITVRSEPGKGSTFTILLPAAVKDADEPTCGQDARDAGKAITILLCQAEDGMRRTNREILTEEGYEVLDVKNGREAWRCVREHGGRVHLLITDVLMPGINGRDLATAMAAQYPGLCAILVADRDRGEASQGEEALRRGFAVLWKPFSGAAFREKVRHVVDNCARSLTRPGRA